MSLRKLESSLGLRFRDQGLLRQALVHGSLPNEQGGSPLDSYERMEFLGDSVLGLAVSSELYRRCPELSEGELSKMRSSLVCGEALAQVARRLKLGRYLQMGKGEESTGGRERESTLAAAFEAVVAAVYLDTSYEEASSFVLRILSQEITQVISRSATPGNPKSRLQEYIQGLGQPTPRYRLVSTEGPDHNPFFTVEVLVDDQVVGTGKGGKKADAERAAALDALERLASEASERG